MNIAEIQADKMNKGRIRRVELIRNEADAIKEHTELCASQAEEALALWQEAEAISSRPPYEGQEIEIRQTLFRMEAIEISAASKSHSVKTLDYMLSHDVSGSVIYSTTAMSIHDASVADCEFPKQRT